ncbi:MAG: peptidylprolyl isomerase [Gammaproteobacteria bacterium]|nr:peptidylprolyl isomerase [Gammaproteobacteria bacterium]MDA7962273.1 peptidylprolyl isomerase [Gammaproteobacteria bacterium]MDA7969801.1 peptidylprolyl isomerase [Gammaproteobacteria bacterium]MDA7971161.1 peptidylprolyl isomerase [Gammaproteobacteria bacterium]MDA8023870.1 peptidylprolyl isomerase [Gammaproteobacteria bacterium]
MMRIAAKCVLALWLGAPAAAALAQAVAIDKVLVVVNEEPVMLSEYQARHQRESLQNAAALAPFDGSVDLRVLNSMIDDRIQAQMAARRGLRVSDEEVENAIAFIAEQNNSGAGDLLQMLSSRGITPSQFRASIREQQLIRRLVDVAVNARVVVSDREIENYLTSHSELLASEEAFEISHLFISLQDRPQSEAESELENLRHIRRALLAGRSFADSAREFSDSPSAKEGGYVGWRKAEQLPALFVEALRKMKDGAISQPLRGENGLHLLQLHERKASGNVVVQNFVRHIMIRSGAERSPEEAAQFAAELRARILGGEDFETLARAHSDDAEGSVEGGRLGWVSPGELPQTLENAVRDLPLNQLSEPLRTGTSFHLLEVLGRRENDISRDLAAQRARRVIFRRKAAEFYDNWYGTIRDTAFIEYIAVNPG